MNRRGFIGAILAAGVAPAIVRTDSLMRIIPHKTLIVGVGCYVEENLDSSPFDRDSYRDLASALAEMHRQSHIFLFGDPSLPKINYDTILAGELNETTPVTSRFGRIVRDIIRSDGGT